MHVLLLSVVQKGQASIMSLAIVGTVFQPFGIIFFDVVAIISLGELLHNLVSQWRV
jgi:hypothetical protein